MIPAVRNTVKILPQTGPLSYRRVSQVLPTSPQGQGVCVSAQFTGRVWDELAASIGAQPEIPTALQPVAIGTGVHWNQGDNRGQNKEEDPTRKEGHPKTGGPALFSHSTSKEVYPTPMYLDVRRGYPDARE
jgi:hypothetical protein